MTGWLLLILTIIVAGVVWTEFRKRYIRLQESFDLSVRRYSELESQKRSSEVRLGLIAEQMAPYLSGFPCNTQDIHFLGQPIDYIGFDEKGVHFIEVKSGEAKLSPKQRKIRDDIQAGKVFWHVVKVK